MHNLALRAEDLPINIFKQVGQAGLEMRRILRTELMRKLDRIILRVSVMGSMLLAGGFLGAVQTKALVGYNGGAFVNLCGTGTAATAYTCSAACSTSTGSCTGTNNGVVKYVCSGRWDQCFESESYWSNSVDVGSQACGKTVQISVFDKKCRREDGSWDPTCNLQGFMVWYSGDCWSGVGPTPTPFPRGPVANVPTGTRTPTPAVSLSPTPTVRISPTMTVTPTPRLNGAAVCGQSCVMQSDCGAGYTCYQGVCRNAACRATASCECGTIDGSATGSGTKSPQTGGEEVLLLLVPLLGAGGVAARKFASKLA